MNNCVKINGSSDSEAPLGLLKKRSQEKIPRIKVRTMLYLSLLIGEGRVTTMLDLHLEKLLKSTTNPNFKIPVVGHVKVRITRQNLLTLHVIN